ncbi:distal tail protein Dit [Clostridium celatum]|uniref:distal tail protein Dit n=1 Tax=Clostridium celatum TaxID=36834 RepID=UPI00290444C8|nr:distal tail protein Dit [Clostridium celatum]MDU2265263.1 phage tail family protein [Clostridium celatum]MDU6295989.1 phage tail family protein [Clostridium celatum]
MFSFNFRGENSFSDYGVYISKRPSIPSPKRRITNVVIPGKSSSLRFDENTYEDITIAVECSIKDDILPNKIDEIKEWLLSYGESDLVFSNQHNKKYIAQVVNVIDFTQVLKYISKFVIVFNCRPFKYEVESDVIEMTAEGSVTNPGSISSEPIIKIFGSGDINLTINSEVIKLKEVTNHIILDSVQQNCYNEAIDNLNNKMTGEFPKFEIGENNISWIGSVSKMEVIPNWRWL